MVSEKYLKYSSSRISKKKSTFESSQRSQFKELITENSSFPSDVGTVFFYKLNEMNICLLSFLQRMEVIMKIS
jgi:hypothetical protein